MTIKPTFSTITLVRQPDGVTCAQAVSAMLLGVDVWHVLEHLPAKRGGTKHRKMIEFLRSRGVDLDTRFRSARKPPWPVNAIVRVTWPDGKGHVVLKQSHYWFDPEHERPFAGTLPSDRRYAIGRVTSFCEVYAL